MKDRFNMRHMIRGILSAHVVAGLVILLVMGMNSRLHGADQAIKMEAQLIWGTNDSKSPDPKHKPVEPAVMKKLKDLPLKWTHYFEVNRRVILVEGSTPKKQVLSDKCTVEIKNTGKTKFEVSLIGKGEQVVKQTQDFSLGETLVLGGNAPNATAWLVFLKRLE